MRSWAGEDLEKFLAPTPSPHGTHNRGAQKSRDQTWWSLLLGDCRWKLLVYDHAFPEDLQKQRRKREQRLKLPTLDQKPLVVKSQTLNISRSKNPLIEPQVEEESQKYPEKMPECRCSKELLRWLTRKDSSLLANNPRHEESHSIPFA